MNKYTATVIEDGNSYALRVPKRYIDDAKLELGQKTDIQLPMPDVKQFVRIVPYRLGLSDITLDLSDVTLL